MRRFKGRRLQAFSLNSLYRGNARLRLTNITETPCIFKPSKSNLICKQQAVLLNTRTTANDLTLTRMQQSL